MFLDHVTDGEFLVAAREERLAVRAVVFGGGDAAHCWIFWGLGYWEWCLMVRGGCRVGCV